MRAASWIAALAALVLGCWASGCAGGSADAASRGATNAPPGASNQRGAAQPLVANQPANGQADPAKPEPDKPSDVPQAQADYIPFEGGLRVYPARKVAELRVVLLGNQTRPLEFLLVAPGGATHESLFASGAKGEHLKRALEMIGLIEAATKRSGRGYIDTPLGDKVKISVRFNHAGTGKETIVPVEDWLYDVLRNGQPEAAGWVFTGSFEQYDPRLNRSLIESDMKGNLIALWRDASCVIDNARKNGVAPDCYSPNPKADGIPDAQTEVTLIFEKYKD